MLAQFAPFDSKEEDVEVTKCRNNECDGVSRDIGYSSHDQRNYCTTANEGIDNSGSSGEFTLIQVLHRKGKDVGEHDGVKHSDGNNGPQGNGSRSE